MSVYTKVSFAELSQFLERYQLGPCLELQPIAAGVTNTNYYFTAADNSYVLTLYEHHNDDDINYILGLQRHLAEHSIPCAKPELDRRGDCSSILNNRPAAIILWLPGKVVDEPGTTHVCAAATALARFHMAGADYAGSRQNPRGLDWMIATEIFL